MTLGVIGCGNMGSALLRGIVESRLLPARKILAWDANAGKLRAVARRLKIRAGRSNREVARGSSVLLLAVKPQQMEGVLKEIRPALRGRALVISIAAGIPTRWVEKRLGRGIPVVRVMPNTPALVGRGISAVALGRCATRAHGRVAGRILARVGEVVPLPERQMDAVTAVSGSGPAYFFYLMEQMIEAGVSMGLSRPVARRLAVAPSMSRRRAASSAVSRASSQRPARTSRSNRCFATHSLFGRRRWARRASLRAASASPRFTDWVNSPRTPRNSVSGRSVSDSKNRRAAASSPAS